jgi:hypothetical protein
MVIGSFKQYLVEEEKTVYFTFGRMNPPTIGHGKLLDKLASAAGKNPYRIYLSQSNDKKKNPLKYSDKIKHVRRMFPKHARQVIVDKNAYKPHVALSALYDAGFRKVVMVAGSDRIQQYEALNMYNGKKGAHGFYNFEGGIKIISAGARDPDVEGAEGSSASKQREYASSNDFTGFAQALPKAMSNSDAKRLFNDVRKGMGLKEATDFRNHVQLEPVSEVRESYVEGKLYEVGDEVVIKENGEIGKVKRLGPNYVIIESKSNHYRKWLDAVERVEQKYPEYQIASFSQKLTEDNTKSMYADKPDWGTPESTKKAKKMTPGQNEEFDIEEITADFSVDKQGQLTVELDDLHEGTNNPNIWDNIRKRRAKGLPPRKPGEKGYPKTLDLPEDGPCWPGYKQVGTKMKNGKAVPNCVPESTVNEKIQVAQDPDIDDRKGSQPATFQKGIKSKSTKAARDAHFKKMAKRDDHKNPDLYKPAPGDATAKTKPSQYTKRFKAMYGEETNPVDIAKQRIDREKKADAQRHDRMMDRARTRATNMKNKETKPNG